MTLLRLAVTALLATLITLTHADRTSFHLPDGFNASVLTQVRIDQNIEAGSELRSRFDFYRLYLSVEPPGWGAGPICWLAFLTRLDDQLINITIPADVVPDKTRVRLSTSLIHKGTGRNNGWDYSHRVTVSGGNGTWSERELAGRGVGTYEDDTSCFAYGCVRGCAIRFWEEGEGNATAEREEDLCNQQCLKDFNPPKAAGVMASVPLVGMLLFSAAAVLAQYL
jgi:hypothetical protein